MDPMDAFAELMGQDDDEIEIDRAALLFSAAEYPGLDVEAWLDMLDAFAERLGPRLFGPKQPLDIARIVAEFLHVELGFHGNAESYYDPRNSYLNDVIERRQGIPISLSTIYLALGRRLGVPFEGVGMPGHFLVRLRHHRSPVLLDPFQDGVVMDDAACEARLRGLYGPNVRLLPSMLTAVTPRQMVFRSLNNLKSIYFGQADWARAVRTVDLMLLTQPGALGEYRDRANAHLRLGDLRRARADFEHYLLNAVDMADAGSVREQLELIDRLESRRN
ncbi:MAG: transglutaminase family protein [Chloroflexi bacterium]|nr:transglutaminase family protein [Chloroflexota bacterium]